MSISPVWTKKRRNYINIQVGPGVSKVSVSGTLFQPAQAVIVPENGLHENFAVSKQCASLVTSSLYSRRKKNGLGPHVTLAWNYSLEIKNIFHSSVRFEQMANSIFWSRMRDRVIPTWSSVACYGMDGKNSVKRGCFQLLSYCRSFQKEIIRQRQSAT